MEEALTMTLHTQASKNLWSEKNLETLVKYCDLVSLFTMLGEIIGLL